MSIYKSMMMGIALGAVVGAVLTAECPEVRNCVTKGKDMAKQKIESIKSKQPQA